MSTNQSLLSASSESWRYLWDVDVQAPQNGCGQCLEFCGSVDDRVQAATSAQLRIGSAFNLTEVGVLTRRLAANSRLATCHRLAEVSGFGGCSHSRIFEQVEGIALNHHRKGNGRDSLVLVGLHRTHERNRLLIGLADGADQSQCAIVGGTQKRVEVHAVAVAEFRRCRRHGWFCSGKNFGLVVAPSSVVSCGVLNSGVLATTVDTMKTRPLLKPLALVAVSILMAFAFHVGWLAAFIPAAKSGVFVLKILGWMLAPFVTALGYATGLRLGERVLTTRNTDFLRIFVWPLVGCTLGATALSWVGPMWVGIGTFIGGATSVVLREVKLLIA